jgi:hypothetical protein
MSAMPRKLMPVGLVALIIVVVVAVLSRRQPAEKQPIAEAPEKAPPAAPSRANVFRGGEEQRPPADCVALADGGFSCGACRDDTDCPPQHGCFVNVAGGRTECQGSECKRDNDCPGQLLCRTVARTLRGDPMRGCVASGTRTEGTACDPDNGGDPSVSCAGKLLCINGGCAATCDPPEYPERSNCPGELRCVTTLDGSACTPTCKEQQRATGKDPCTGGKVCEFLSVEHATSMCVERVGQNCLGSKGGCPAGTECLAETNVKTERTTFACHPKCDPAAPACAADAVCVPSKPNSHCRRRCSPGPAVACASGERCKRAQGPGAIWYCSAT